MLLHHFGGLVCFSHVMIPAAHMAGRGFKLFVRTIRVYLLPPPQSQQAVATKFALDSLTKKRKSA